MSGSRARTVVIVTGLITAVVHLIILNLMLGKIDPLFTPNGIGYLVLLGLFYLNPGFVSGNRKLLHYAFMLFTGLTIVAFFIFGHTGFDGQPPDLLGWFTKLDEVVLIAALWRNMRYETSAESTTMI